jgi:hypothetical protein
MKNRSSSGAQQQQRKGLPNIYSVRRSWSANDSDSGHNLIPKTNSALMAQSLALKLSRAHHAEAGPPARSHRGNPKKASGKVTEMHQFRVRARGRDPRKQRGPAWEIPTRPMSLCRSETADMRKASPGRKQRGSVHIRIELFDCGVILGCDKRWQAHQFFLLPLHKCTPPGGAANESCLDWNGPRATTRSLYRDCRMLGTNPRPLA